MSTTMLSQIALAFLTVYGYSSYAASINNVETRFVPHHEQENTIETRAVMGTFSLVAGYANLLNGLISGSGARSSMAQVLEKLKLIEERVDEIQENINNVLKNQAHLANVVSYSKDIQRLEFLLHNFEREIRYENDTFVPAGQATKWADEVVSLSDTGLDQVLRNIHNMIKGGTIFSPDSIFKTYEALLDRSSSSYVAQYQLFAEYTLSLQAAGYAMWFNARIIKGIAIESIQTLMSERLTKQNEFLSEIGAIWPGGSWGIPMPEGGCPYNHQVTFGTGYRLHDTDSVFGGFLHLPYNAASDPNHFPSGDVSFDLKQRFCMKTSGGVGQWPAGDYCIFADDGCPAGFQCGYYRWDDEDTINHNSVSGELPRGVYDSNTKIYYGCRGDGSASTEIVLPPLKSFYLFRFRGSCQQVKHMSVTSEWLYWDDEDSRNNNSSEDPHPYTDGETRNTKMHYCYYTPTTFA